MCSYSFKSYLTRALHNCIQCSCKRKHPTWQRNRSCDASQFGHSCTCQLHDNHHNNHNNHHLHRIRIITITQSWKAKVQNKTKQEFVLTSFLNDSSSKRRSTCVSQKQKAPKASRKVGMFTRKRFTTFLRHPSPSPFAPPPPSFALILYRFPVFHREEIEKKTAVNRMDGWESLDPCVLRLSTHTPPQ